MSSESAAGILSTTIKNSTGSEEGCPVCITRVTASSKVNFSKLLDEEKEMRFRNMSKEIKHLRRKLRILEAKMSGGNDKGEVPSALLLMEEKPEDIFLQAE